MSPARSLSPLLIATISYDWVLAGLLFNATIGPDYSRRRYTTIEINLSVMTLCTLWVLALERSLRWILYAACALTASVWLYTAIMSSVV